MNTDIFLQIARSHGAALPQDGLPLPFYTETPRMGLNGPANGKSAIHGTLIHLENGGCLVSSHEDQTDNENEGKYSQ
tara:strand:+ start:2139 stop:2369 length:231 start_codon:yes stop_codon:yes gene_type:complete